MRVFTHTGNSWWNNGNISQLAGLPVTCASLPYLDTVECNVVFALGVQLSPAAMPHSRHTCLLITGIDFWEPPGNHHIVQAHGATVNQAKAYGDYPVLVWAPVWCGPGLDLGWGTLSLSRPSVFTIHLYEAVAVTLSMNPHSGDITEKL